MFSNSITSTGLIASVTKRRSSRWLALVMALIFFGWTTASFAAYSFLTVTGNNIPGNAASTTFTGTNGVINVTHTFSPGGAGSSDNGNFIAGFDPSQFTILFPGTGLVQGHLAQTVYNHTSVVNFDMTGYTITPNTVFGVWNTTDEVTAPAGGNPVYQIQLINSSNVQVNPTTFNLIGNQDNQTQVAGRHTLVMNPSNGEITFGGLINPSGTHTNAAFWDNIPVTTKNILVYGDLPPLNNIGDGVGYYFAELVPEPGSLALCAGGLVALSVIRRRR